MKLIVDSRTGKNKIHAVLKHQTHTACHESVNNPMILRSGEPTCENCLDVLADACAAMQK